MTRDDGGDASDKLGLGLVTVFVLSGLAGAVDACGLTILNDLFVSFMSGNSTSLAVAIGHGDRGRILLIAPIIATFVAGAAAGTMLATLVGRRHLPAVVAFVAAILVVPVVWPPATILAMTFSMGALNAAMNHAGDVTVSITYVTGTLAKFGAGLGRLACGQAKGWSWLQQGVPWLGLVVGGIAAAGALAHFGRATIGSLPVVALVIAAGTWPEVRKAPA